MEFRLLGPLEVVDDGRPLALGGPKQRSLLAVLLLSANEVVSTDRLIDELWGDTPPATVAKSVQVYVSRLRKQLGAERLVTRDPGYLLRADPVEIDAARFELLVEEARTATPQEAARALREALSLWRGQPLADLAYERFAAPVAARFEELRLTALEDRFEADLATGRHAELTAELESVVAEHPLRERLRRQHMLALYRSGRQAESLESYRRTRALLIDELGIEPGPELRRLEGAVLAQDSSLDGTTPTDRASAGSTGFVGREAELERLGEALDRALAGEGRIALLAGEPGIGKSRLAEELAKRARGGSTTVLVGRCWEAGGAPAYWPWVQALRTHIRTTPVETLRAQAGDGAADLAQILPELQTLLPGLGQPAAPDSEGARLRLFEAVAGLLAAIAETQPVVLVLDDLHAADEPSLLLLRYLARQIADRRVLAVCAFRDVDPALRAPLTTALAELTREPLTLHVALSGLSERDVAAYIEQATGSAPSAELVSAIESETEGNPLFVGEIVRLLEAEGRVDDAGAHLDIPPGVRAVIGQRVGRLSERCRSTLAAASVLGREFEVASLAELTGLELDDLLDVLEEALRERILGDVPGSHGRLRFSHALIRDTLYDELTATRRLQLHRQAGEAVERVHAGDLEAHLSEIAQHFCNAATGGTTERAIGYARRAGEHAAAQLAYEEAVRHYELALTLAADSAERCDLLLAAGDAHARAGNGTASKRAYDEAATLAERAGLDEHFARAALGYGGRIIWDVSRDDPHLLELLEQALERLSPDDGPLRVRVMARMAGGPLRDGPLPRDHCERMSDEALAMARRLDDRATLAYALHSAISAHLSPEFTAGLRLQLAAELLDVAAELGDGERVLDGHSERSEALFELGRGADAERDLEAMERVARRLRQPSQDWFTTAHRARLALMEGRLTDAEAFMAEAHRIGDRAQTWNANVTFRLHLFVLRREQGRLAESRDLLRSSADEYPSYPVFRCVNVLVDALLGDEIRSRAALTELAAGDFEQVPMDEEWLVSMAMLAEAASVLPEPGAASRLYELVLPYRDRVAVSPQEMCLGAVSRYLGLLALTIGSLAEAREHLEHALELNERLGARPWLTRTQLDYAALVSPRSA